MSCNHGSVSDHSYVTHTGVRLWRCSRCDRAPARWGDGWAYYGAVECLACGGTPVDEVVCDQCAPAALRGKPILS